MKRQTLVEHKDASREVQAIYLVIRTEKREQKVSIPFNSSDSLIVKYLGVICL